jgi:SAM-dependent MidA family methyltransferase
MPPLPLPDSAALASHHLLQDRLKLKIAAQGPLSFADYMAEALYAPALGYYSGGSHKLGAAGDFITAPLLSPLFAATLATPIADVLTQIGGDLLEFGAGSGDLAADLLLALEQRHTLPDRYLILDLSGELRQRQHATIAARAPHLADRCHWLDRMPTRLHGVVIANELLDAMPCHLFALAEEGAVERTITWHDDRLIWSQRPPPPPLATALDALLASLPPLPVGYHSEINLNYAPWLATLSTALQRGVILLIDYGFPRHEYYHPQRSQGTLMCHYRHHAHSDPLWLVGLQDITAHVDFTAVAEAASDSGLQIAGYTSQAAFLLANGITDHLAAWPGDERSRLSASNAVKRLTLPHEMGELFKVMALGKEWPGEVKGFTLRDDRRRL